MASKLTFRQDACKGCALCMQFCPKKLLEEDPDILNRYGVHPVTIRDQASCVGCANCAVMCPDGVIRVERESAPDKRQ